MPILKASGSTAALYQELDAQGVLDGEIPTSLKLEDPADFIDVMGSSALRQAEWSWGTLRLEQDVGRFMVGSTATNIGFPKGSVFNGAQKLLRDPNPGKTLKDAFKDLDGRVSSLSLGTDFLGVQATTGIVGDAMEAAFGGAFDAIGHISGLARDLVPVVGSVTNAIVKAIRFFHGVTQPSEPAEFSYRIQKFSPTHDRSFANVHILEPLNTGKDWTPIWSPPGFGSDPAQLQPDFTVTAVKDNQGDGWGVRVQPVDGERHVGSGWTGAIPLSGNIDLGWEISRQGTDYTGTRSLGALLPTSREQIGKLWAMCLKPGSPTAFCVDAQAVRDRWFTYLMNFRMFLQSTNLVRPDARRTFIDELGVDYYGWKPFNPNFKASGKNTKQLQSAFGLDDSSDLFKAVDQLEKTQRATLDSVGCAYVTKEFAAIKSNPALRDRLERNRQSLLSHPAVCRVDLDLVPDAAYRNAVKNAQIGRGCGSGMILTAGPLVQNGGTAPPPAQGLNGIKTATLMLNGSGGGGGKGALLLAAAMLGLVAIKGKKR